jgi:hypothetical protein
MQIDCKAVFLIFLVCNHFVEMCRYPSHARMWLAPIRSGLTDRKKDDVNCAMNDWHSFVQETEAHYGVNMGVLTKAFREENEKYDLKVLQYCWFLYSRKLNVPFLYLYVHFYVQ